LNKDVNFIREAYPNNSSSNYSLPKYYAIFGSSTSNVNELTAIIGPTPDQSYNSELHYFYYPATIVQGLVNGTGSLIGGTLYTTGNYTNVPLTGGSGSGATANITVSGGAVTNFSIQNGGNFYIVGDVLSASNSYLGNTGSGFSITVTAISNSIGQSWLGDNYDPVLLYGALREASVFMKQEVDMIKNYEDKYQEAMAEMKRLGDGLERGDAYRDGQTKLMVKT
jgi:hypothetical protein